MKELLEVIAKNLVDDPSSVSVKETAEEDGTMILELTVSENDMGKVIGKQGRIAKSIRTVIKAAAIHEDKKVVVKIM
ncbi:MAG: KH domain-containing protein [Firmicutes bacterium]|nr:KH domain-containing protein [Bacillota bacterium]